MSEAAAIALEAAFASVDRAPEDDLLINEQGSDRLQFEYLRTLYPSLIEYRGGLFVEANFDLATVDDILAHSGDADPIITAQKHVNSVGLDWGEDRVDPMLGRAIGEGIAFAWTHWIRDRFGREISTRIDIDDVSGVVWFRAAQ